MKKKMMVACLVFSALPFFATGQNLTRFFKNTYACNYFIFHYNDDVTHPQELARFCDGFIGMIDREFFPAKFPYPIRVYVLKDKPSFQKFLREQVDVSDPPGWGIYLPKIKSFITYEGSGNGTFAHEIMHPLVRANLAKAPYWADEGIPSFFEKSFGYWNKNQLTLSLGYQNAWRIRELDNRILTLDLESIITSKEQYGTSEKRLVSVFLYENQRLKRYLQLVRLNDKQGYDTFLEAAFQAPLHKVVPAWKIYLQNTYRDRIKIDRIPGSCVFDSKNKYDLFMKIAGLPN